MTTPVKLSRFQNAVLHMIRNGSWWPLHGSNRRSATSMVTRDLVEYSGYVNGDVFRITKAGLAALPTATEHRHDDD